VGDVGAESQERHRRAARVREKQGSLKPLAAKLATVHDGLTWAGFGAAAVCLAAIVCAFCYEVVSRYFLNAPTEWASPVVSFALCAMIFLAMPELTRRAAHIAINTLPDHLSARHRAMLLALVRIVAAVACLLAAWFSGSETLDQLRQEIWTSPPFAVPKWTISIFVPYGMLSSGIYFLRHLAGRAPASAAEVTTA
jgi:TRAP-type C4-dicarboxylate transport system permease small subunit